MKIEISLDINIKDGAYGIDVLRIQDANHVGGSLALLYIDDGVIGWDLLYFKAIKRFVLDWKHNHNF